MLRFIRGGKGLPEEGILLLPDSMAVREAVVIALEDDGARLGPWTFTPTTYLQELNSEIPQVLDEAREAMILKRIITNDPEVSIASAGLVMGVKGAVNALRRVGIFNSEELFAALRERDFSISNRQRHLGRILDAYQAELTRRGIPDKAQWENTALQVLIENGPKTRQNAHALWFNELRYTDARIIAALAKFIDVDFYLPAKVSWFKEKRFAESLLAGKAQLARTAVEFGVEIDEFDTAETEPEAPLAIEAISLHDGQIDEIPSSGIGDWPFITCLEARNAMQEADLAASAAKSLILDNGLIPEAITIFSEAPEMLVLTLEEHGLPYSGASLDNFNSSATAQLLGLIRDMLEQDLSRESFQAFAVHPLIAIEMAEEFDSFLCKTGRSSYNELDKTAFEIAKKENLVLVSALESLISQINRIFGSAFGLQKIDGIDFKKIIEKTLEEFKIKEALSELASRSGKKYEAELAGFESIRDRAGFFEESPPDTFGGHLAMLFELLSSQGGEDRGGGGIRIRSLLEAPRSSSRATIVMNCVQGGVPRAFSDRFFLTSAESLALRIELPDAPLREFCNILALDTELLILTRPLSEGNSKLAPSPIVVSLFRALKSKDEYRKKMVELAEGLLKRPFTTRRRQVTAGEILVSENKSFNREGLAGIDFLPDVQRALKILNPTSEDERCRYDGRIGEVFSEVFGDLYSRMGVTSVNSLNKCPYKYLFETILGVSGRPKPESALDALREGTAIHKALEVFWKGRIEAFFGPDSTIEERIERVKSDFNGAFEAVQVTSNNIEAARSTIDECVSAAMAELNDIPDEDVKFDFSLTLRRSLEKYVESELNLSENKNSFIPVATETKDQIEIDGKRISGKVDRIDSDDMGRLRIVDYKRSNSPSHKDIRTLKDLQMLLYFLLMQEKGEIGVGLFWSKFSKATPEISGKIERDDCKTNGSRSWIAESDLNSLLDACQNQVKELFKSLDCGDFPATSSNECNHCPFASSCRAVSLGDHDEEE